MPAPIGVGVVTVAARLSLDQIRAAELRKLPQARTFHLARCIGGWNVWGFDDRSELVFECCHLHKTARDARSCPDLPERWEWVGWRCGRMGGSL